MKVLGIVAEYNPFHLGHKYHLEKSKQITRSDYSIAVMTGSFVQRGEPSFVDKWTKAKMAIDNGVDLVIELPFIFSVQSAEIFALGSIKLLNSLNIVDYITFGNELGSLADLDKIAQILIDEPPYLKQKLQEYIHKGNSFPMSRSKALKSFFDHYKDDIEISENIQDILKMSNNILAIEYLKALTLLKSTIKPVSIKRIGNLYGDKYLNNTIASATGIRNSILNNGVEPIREYLPDKTFKSLKNYLHQYKEFNSLNNYNQIIHYLLQIKDKKSLINIMDVESGLENRIVKKSTIYKNVDHLIQSISTKRYPKTRIQRILIHLMANLTKPLFDELLPHHPSYIRILGSNEKGFQLLNKIKENSNLPIITKFADYNQHNNLYLNKIISLDEMSTNLYFAGLNVDKPFIDMDYHTTPYIVKNNHLY